MSKDQLSKREIVYIDIANDPIPHHVIKNVFLTWTLVGHIFHFFSIFKDYKEDEDPTKFLSKKTGRGQLKPNWRDHTQPLMCCYKLVTVEFKWFGLQGRVEKFIQQVREFY